MTGRTANCLAKLDRMNKTLRHEEADRVPISDFFWGSFLERWRADLDLPADTDIYTYYDLDWIVTVPNMDPHIKDFEVIRENDKEVVVRTGFEAVLRKKFADPMPEFIAFETDTIDKVDAFEFDDPWDEYRYFSGGDNQIGGVGDGYARNLPPWIDTVKSLRPNFPVYGSQCEANEYMVRIIGLETFLLWIALYPERTGRLCPTHQRVGARAAQGHCAAQTERGQGRRPDLSIRPLGAEQRFRPINMTMSSSWCASTASTRSTWASMTSRI